MRPKGPCGTLFRLKVQFDCSENPCGTTCHSQTEIYDIGTEILCKTCFGHNSTQNQRKSMIFSGFCTEFYVHCESAINLSKNDILGFATIVVEISKFCPLRAYHGSPFTKYSKILAPAGILREPFYKLF